MYFKNKNQLEFIDDFSTREEILFTITKRGQNNIIITRHGDIEFTVTYNRNGWSLEFIKLEKQVTCLINHWCIVHDCSLDYIDNDDYCFECPRYIEEAIILSFCGSKTWSMPPRTLTELRLDILHEYKETSHNDLYK
jgi:hypothetical protein